MGELGQRLGRFCALLVGVVGIVFGVLAYQSLTPDTITVLSGMACAGAILMPITVFVGWVAFQSLRLALDRRRDPAPQPQALPFVIQMPQFPTAPQWGNPPQAALPDYETAPRRKWRTVGDDD